jgi:hypothetical protein
MLRWVAIVALFAPHYHDPSSAQWAAQLHTIHNSPTTL